MDKNKCSKCDIQMLGETTHINCTVCDNKFCKPCSKIEDVATWEVLRARKFRGLTWMCNPCEHSGGLKSLERISKKLEEQTNQMTEMKQELNMKIDDQTNTLNQLIESKIMEKFEKEKVLMIAEVKESLIEDVKETISKSVNAAVDEAIKELPKAAMQAPTDEASIHQLSPGSQIKRTVSRVSTELEERAKRKCNVIVLGLEESDKITKEDSIKDDTEKLNKIAKEVLKVSLRPSDMKDIRRLGPPRQDVNKTD